MDIHYKKLYNLYNLYWTKCSAGWAGERKTNQDTKVLKRLDIGCNQVHHLSIKKGIIKQSSHRTSSVWMQRNTRLFSSYPLCLSVSHKINSTNESLIQCSTCHWLRESETDHGIQIHKSYKYLYPFTWRTVALWTRFFGRRGCLSGNFSSKYCTSHQVLLENTHAIDKVFHQISWIQLDKRSC